MFEHRGTASAKTLGFPPQDSRAVLRPHHGAAYRSTESRVTRVDDEARVAQACACTLRHRPIGRRPAEPSGIQCEGPTIDPSFTARGAEQGATGAEMAEGLAISAPSPIAKGECGHAVQEDPEKAPRHAGMPPHSGHCPGVARRSYPHAGQRPRRVRPARRAGTSRTCDRRPVTCLERAAARLR
jgi:hypothetical protein